MNEFFSAVLLPVLAAALTALFGYLGAQLKRLYEQKCNDRTKRDVVRTAVKAAEQLYHDLDGRTKLQKAIRGATDMLNEKGVPISALELRQLIESCVCEFNYRFGTLEGAEEEEEGDPL